MGNLGGISAKTQIRMVDGSSLNPFENENKDFDVTHPITAEEAVSKVNSSSHGNWLR